MSRLRVKMILPALTEATSPFWRPIGPRCSRRSAWPRSPATCRTITGGRKSGRARGDGPSVDDAPDLVVIQVYITSARRA